VPSVTAGYIPRDLRGAIPVPRSHQSPENRPWRNPPQSWGGPATEWSVYWYLSVHGIEPNGRKLTVGIDYYYQRGLAAPGLFLRKPFTRGDFVLPGYGKLHRGVVLDPVTPFTHKEYWFDLQKRRILAREGWQVIFIDAPDLYVFPGRVVELGLRGVDISQRGRSS
jgi:hypothetical protein